MWLNAKNILLAVTLTAFLFWSGVATEIDLQKLLYSIQIADEIAKQWFPPNGEKVELAVDALLLTLQMAFLGSFVALLIVLPLSFLAAKNTSPNLYIYQLMRGFFSLLRSVPDIVFGLIFVMAIGLGPFPAVLAIMLHNIGVLGKLISELIESAERGPQEAIYSLGLGRSMNALYGILPQIIPNVLSHYFYRFEVAIRTSLILGFIGGGGIGQLLFNAFKTFKYTDVMMYVIVIMGLVIVVDMFGSYVRNRII